MANFETVQEVRDALAITAAGAWRLTRARFNTHDHYAIDYIIDADSEEDTVRAYRVQDLDTGGFWTKLSGDAERYPGIALDPESVDHVMIDVLNFQYMKNIHLPPLMGAAISGSPLLDKDGNLSGVGDWSEDENGILVCDFGSALSKDQKTAIMAAIAGSVYSGRVTII